MLFVWFNVSSIFPSQNKSLTGQHDQPSFCFSSPVSVPTPEEGGRAELLYSTWDLPGPGMEPTSPSLAGGFFTTEPPGKPWMLSFKPAFSLSSFTFSKRLFSSSSLSAVRVVSSTYLRLLKFLLAFLTLACNSSSLAFCKLSSAYKLNKQCDSK